MKLFIINKEKLDIDFPENGNNRYQTAKQIHQEAFRELQLSLNVEYAIPLCLTPSYKDAGVVLLDFVSRKGDIFYYNYTTTAS